MASILTNRQRVLYLDGNDLTIDGRVATPTVGRDPIDVTTFNDVAHRNEVGMKIGSVAYSGLYSAAAQRTWTALTTSLSNAIAGTYSTVSVYLETDAVGLPGVGFRAAFPEGLTPAGAPGEAEEIGVNLVAQQQWDILTALVGKGSITTNSTGTTVSRGASSTAGGALYVHAFSVAATGTSASWTVALQDAATATGTYTSVATLTVSSGTAQGSAVAFTGTLRAFVRVLTTLNGTSASGTLEYQAGFAAN